MRLHLVLVSMLTIGGWVAFMGIALLWLGASEAAVLGISIPVWVAFLAWPILGERLSLLRAVRWRSALAGITVLIGGNGVDASVGEAAGNSVRAGRRGLCRAGHGADKAFSVGHAAAFARRLADRDWLRADRDRRACARATAVGGAVAGRLGVNGLHDADPVLSLLRLLVRRARAIAGRYRIDRHLAGAGGRRAGGGAMLHEPLGLREIAALAFTLGGVAVALRS